MTEPALSLIITNAGLARFTAAQVDDDIDLGITSVGLTDQVFVVAPTLTALPGQFRSVATISGEARGDNVVHMIVRDAAPLTYTIRGFGLFLADGTLFAVYGQAEPIFEKATAATMLLALDMAFPTGDVSSITFGDTNFLNPPATTEMAGVVRLADDAALEDRLPDRVATAADVFKVLAMVLPIGLIAEWFGAAEAVPAGWALCHGQTIARSDGAGNITLPDMRDRVPVGASATHALGAPFGAFVKEVESSEEGSHVHGVGELGVTIESSQTGATFQYSTKGDTASGGTGKTLAVPPDGNAPVPPGIDDPGHDHDATVAGATAAAGLHSHDVEIDVSQPSLALHFIMRV
ncbi:hypothetical protein [Sphingomonas sp.]|uniref:hypothetical protein n=1 Tax=Sphingomonas sp. TaxID=28214 RepID=UPI002EDB3076